MTYQQMVLEFHEKHGYPHPEHIQLDIDDKLKVLRLRLMVEELGELYIAMHEENVVGVADALADLIYVVVGTAICYGIPIDNVFAEVHRSNMTKSRLNKHAKGGKNYGYEEPDIFHALYPMVVEK